MPDPVLTPDLAPVKPGWKTTEFWGSALIVLAGLLYASGAIHPGSGADHWIGLVVAGLTSMGYTAARANVKSAGQ